MASLLQAKQLIEFTTGTGVKEKYYQWSFDWKDLPYFKFCCMVVRLYYGATERKQMSNALGQFFVIFLGTCFDLNPEIKFRNVSFLYVGKNL